VRLEGKNAEARPLYEESLALAREAGDVDSVSIQLVNLASVAIDASDSASARRLLQEGARTAERIAGKYIGTATVTVVGALVGIEGDPSRAARFWGAAEDARERMGVALDLTDAMFLEPHVRRVRAELGEEAFAEASRQGRAVPYEAALAEARAWLEGRG
jgi:hypothetical protein